MTWSRSAISARGSSRTTNNVPQSPDFGKKHRGACKPGSVTRTVCHMAAPYPRRQPFLSALRCRKAPAANPDDHGAKHPCPAPFGRARRPYSALLRVGFAVPLPLPVARCALAAPFHPCLCSLRSHRRSALCGTFPCPSEDGPAGVTRHPFFVEPGLSSAGQRKNPRPTRLPGPPVRGRSLQQSCGLARKLAR